MQTILIAGGNSFIARHLIRKLDRRRYSVIAIVRNLCGIEQISGVTYVELSLNEYNRIGDYVEKCDIFIPFAWDGAQRGELDDEVKNAFSCEALESTIRFLIDSRELKKVILPGSYYEYRNCNRPIDEEAAEIPPNAYGRYKLKLYRTVRAYCEQKHIVCVEVRMFSIYGEDDSDSKLINSIVKKLARNERIVLMHGKQLYSFLYVDDAASAFIKIIGSDRDVIGHYNLSSNYYMQLWGFVQLMRKILESDSEIICEDEDCPAGESIQSIMLSWKLSRDFDWNPEMDFKSGVKIMTDFI